MVLFCFIVALFAFSVFFIAFWRFIQRARREGLRGLLTLRFIDAIFYGRGERREMNVAATAFMAALLSCWAGELLRVPGPLSASPQLFMGAAIAGVFFLLLHCRYFPEPQNTHPAGFDALTAPIHFRGTGLTSPFIWLSRAGYLIWLAGSWLR